MAEIKRSIFVRRSFFQAVRGMLFEVILQKEKLMKKKYLLILLAILVLGKSMNAQQSPADSLKTIKHQKQMLNLAQRIEESKVKLGQLERELVDKSNEKEKAARQADEAANENREAADKLSDDSQDRKKAKRAEKSSDQARRDAKRARRAADNLSDLEKDISKLKRKIAKDEEALAKLTAQTSNQ